MRLTTALAVSIACHAALLGVPGHEQGRQPMANHRQLHAVLLPATISGSGRSVVSDTVIQETEEPLSSVGTAPVTTDDQSAPAQEGSPSESGPEQTDAEQAIISIPLPRYYDPQEVSDRARPRDDIVLDAPELIQYPGAGRAILVLYINEEGRVDQAEVLSTDIDAKPVQESLLKQFRSAQFSPARINGQPVKSKMKIEVTVTPPAIILSRPARQQSTPAAENSSAPPLPPGLAPRQPPGP